MLRAFGRILSASMRHLYFLARKQPVIFVAVVPVGMGGRVYYLAVIAEIIERLPAHAVMPGDAREGAIPGRPGVDLVIIRGRRGRRGVRRRPRRRGRGRGLRLR